NWLKQSLYLDAPAYAGQPITAIVEVVRLRPEKHLVNLRGACTTTGATVCTGESLVLAQNMPETGGKE
ncbi:MAG: oxidoreductase, partial [Anaerolineae bacterium]|nr:oxidoreductase [Anaerolineae bacterium]